MLAIKNIHHFKSYPHFIYQGIHIFLCDCHKLYLSKSFKNSSRSWEGYQCPFGEFKIQKYSIQNNRYKLPSYKCQHSQELFTLCLLEFIFKNNEIFDARLLYVWILDFGCANVVINFVLLECSKNSISNLTFSNLRTLYHQALCLLSFPRIKSNKNQYCFKNPEKNSIWATKIASIIKILTQ